MYCFLSTAADVASNPLHLFQVTMTVHFLPNRKPKIAFAAAVGIFLTLVAPYCLFLGSVHFLEFLLVKFLEQCRPCQLMLETRLFHGLDYEMKHRTPPVLLKKFLQSHQSIVLAVRPLEMV